MIWVGSNQRVHASKTADAMLKPYLSWTYTSKTSLLMQSVPFYIAFLSCDSLLDTV